jgi:DeoR family transcriptional regulator of aga operon
LLPTLERNATGYYLTDDDFVLNQALATKGKLEIAAAAATYILDGMSIALDGGTTTLEVARAVARGFITRSLEQVRITSASLQICMEMLEIPECREAIRSGKLKIWSMEGPLHATCWTMDPPAGASMPWPLDLAIVGANGITRDGFYMPTSRGSEIKRAFIAVAPRVLIVADSSKVGRPLDELFSGWADHICLITNRPSERAARRLLEKIPKGRVRYSEDVLKEAKTAVRREEPWAASRGS